jgi:hypothetical protein
MPLTSALPSQLPPSPATPSLAAQSSLERLLAQLVAVQGALHEESGGRGEPFDLRKHLGPPPGSSGSGGGGGSPGRELRR